MSPKHPVDDLMMKGTKEGVFPGASLLVSHRGQILWNKVYGFAQKIPRPRKLAPTTIFDIASLTKPLATASLFMISLARKKCSLEAPLDSFYARASQKKRITPGHLLNHTSGLPDWKPYFQDLIALSPDWVGTAQGKKWLIHRILEESLLAKPGKRVVYSDLGYILLGDILEKIWEEPLDRLFDRLIAKRLKLRSTFFSSVNDPLSLDGRGPGRGWPSFAATEKCPLRKRILCGEVMDEHAWIMGGVAGHAGLFSTADDIHTWLMELRKSLHGKSHLFPRQIVSLFLKIPKGRKKDRPFFTLGFDTPSKNSQSGKYFSAESVGHLGYAGTSSWWDLKKDIIVILLTNRVHPTRQNEKLREFRPKLHDLIWETLLQ